MGFSMTGKSAVDIMEELRETSRRTENKKKN